MGISVDPDVATSARHSVDGGGGFALLSGSTTDSITQDTTDGGIFSKVLQHGLAGAAARPDGRLTVSDLARHVQRGVAHWRKSPEGKKMGSTQTPVMRLEVADLELFPARRFRELRLAESAIGCAAFAPGGHAMATGCADGSLRFWDTTTWTSLPALGAASGPRGNGEVSCVAFSADGRIVVAVTGPQATVWPT